MRAEMLRTIRVETNEKFNVSFVLTWLMHSDSYCDIRVYGFLPISQTHVKITISDKKYILIVTFHHFRSLLCQNTIFML